MPSRVRLCRRTCASLHLVKLGPGHRHVAEVICKVRPVEYLLGQKVLVVLVQIVARLDLGGEFTVESVVHHPPGHALRHHKWHSVLVAKTKRLTWQENSQATEGNVGRKSKKKQNQSNNRIYVEE